MVTQLPVFEGYTIDARLQEFRRFPEDGLPEFVPFKSGQGDAILCRMIEQGMIEFVAKILRL